MMLEFPSYITILGHQAFGEIVNNIYMNRKFLFAFIQKRQLKTILWTGWQE